MKDYCVFCLSRRTFRVKVCFFACLEYQVFFLPFLKKITTLQNGTTAQFSKWYNGTMRKKQILSLYPIRMKFFKIENCWDWKNILLLCRIKELSWWGLWNSVCLGSESNACLSWVNWLSWLQWSWLSYKKPEDKTKEAQWDEKYLGRACQEKLHMHFVNINHSDF